jgi:hypothetical protein
MIKEESDEEVDFFLNDIDALATDVLELNLCQYSNTFDWFTNIKDGKGTPKIKAAGGIAHLVARKGNLVIPIGKNVKINEEVLYVLNVNSNLLSIRVLTDKGFRFFLTLKMFS